MVLEAVEESIDQGFSLKEGIPVGVYEVGSDESGGTAVPFIHESEEGVDLLGLEGEIAELVDQEHSVTGEGLDQSLSGPVREGSVELIEEILGIEEPAAVSGKDGLTKESDGQSGFARSGITDEDDVLSPLDKGKTRQGLNLASVEIGLALEGKGLQRPVPGDRGLFESMIETPFLPVAVLFHKEPVNQLRERASFPLSPFDLGIEDPLDAFELELCKQWT
jgi:hypothetical protein